MKLQGNLKKITASFAAFLLVANLVLPISVFASDDVETIIEPEVTTVSQAVVEEVAPVAVETEAPVAAAAIQKLTVSSNNKKNRQWATVGDTVKIQFTASAPLNNESVSVIGTGVSEYPTTSCVEEVTTVDEYCFQYTVAAGESVEGTFKFIIKENGAELTQPTLTVEELVTIDMTAPVVKSALDVAPGVATATATPKTLSDSGITVTEATGNVAVTSSWSVPVKNEAGEYVYKVTYIANDQAGNSSTPVEVDVVLTGKDVDSRNSEGVEVTLVKSDNLKSVTELGDTYDDLGATFAWTSGTEIEIWVIGNLNTMAVGDYELTYMATIAAPVTNNTSILVSGSTAVGATRAITVKDTIAPSPVKDFYLTPGNSYIKLNWTNPTDVDFAGVQIWRSTFAGEKGDLLLGKGNLAQGSSYEDSTVLNDVTYYYTLVVFDKAGNPSVASEQLAATPISPKIASTDTDFGYSDSGSEQEETVEEKEIKSSEDKKDEDKGFWFNEKLAGLRIWAWIALLLILGSASYWYFAGRKETAVPAAKPKKKPVKKALKKKK